MLSCYHQRLLLMDGQLYICSKQRPVVTGLINDNSLFTISFELRESNDNL